MGFNSKSNFNRKGIMGAQNFISEALASLYFGTKTFSVVSIERNTQCKAGEVQFEGVQ